MACRPRLTISSKRTTFNLSHHAWSPEDKGSSRIPYPGWAEPILTHGGRALGEYSEAFVAFDIANKKQAVAIAVRVSVIPGHPFR
ncbi:MAG: hypothetical protein EOQ55_32160 [Mesorhizobium sp.]|nr:MAG: hypothetical protein EOQ55_32160 [Mesorhizobium sp.]